MRQQDQRRDSEAIVVVDEDSGVPASLVERYEGGTEVGILAQYDPRASLLSMSEYEKHRQSDVYDYSQATRPEPAQNYPAFAAQQTYTGEYVGSQAQVPSGLPQSAATYSSIPSSQQYGPHDPTYYHQQNARYPAYLEPPRPLPEIISYAPNQGRQGTKVTVYFRSDYDLDVPQVTPVIMFGQKRCQSILQKTPPSGQTPEYALSANAPPLTPGSTPSPSLPLSLTFDDSSVMWQSPSLEFGNFTYLDAPTFYPIESPHIAPRKRKLSSTASPRYSPSKKSGLQPVEESSNITPAASATSPFRRPSFPDVFPATRQFSASDPQGGYELSRLASEQYYGADTVTPSVSVSQQLPWTYSQNQRAVVRSPSATAGAPVEYRPQHSSPVSYAQPPLIRTSALQQSPETPGVATPTHQTFNPYALYSSGLKASLNIEGDLAAVGQVYRWSQEERNIGRRLVQFRRSQSGSIITTTFETVSLETRVPNSICVSCIWWEARQEAYVTSVDTISLLESLVAVRFTVEEKNRIRRNLEGFRPATVSKTKPESEEFFKLIMGFPNPKPRNIEKDVKVFPWRILATALKKIIGKYSASYSSTAGALPSNAPSAAAGPSHSGGRGSDTGMEHHHQRHQQRPSHHHQQPSIASTLSTSSSTASRSRGYATHPMTANPYSPQHTMGGLSGSLGLGPSANRRLAVPPYASSSSQHRHQNTSWHQPAAHHHDYSTDLSATARGGSFDFGVGSHGGSYNYGNPSSVTGLPASAQQYGYAPRMPSLTEHTVLPGDGRFVPLQEVRTPQQQQQQQRQHKQQQEGQQTRTTRA